jgi:hypothetical protein
MRRILTMANLARILTVIFAFILFFYWYLPGSFWTHYYSVEPTKDVFEKGEILSFKSSLVVRHKSPISWNDVLKCSYNNDEFIRVSSYSSSGHNNEILEKTVVWQYLAFTPQKKSTCYLVSHITVNLPFGIHKTQTINGRLFTIQ